MIKKIDKGHSFSIENRIGGYLTQTFGLYLIVVQVAHVILSENFYILLIFLGCLFLAVGSLLSYSYEYLVINYKTGNITDTLNVLGIEFEKKNNLKRYINVSIISRRYTYCDDYADNVDSFYTTQKDHEHKHDLVFLTQNHLGRLLISQFDEYEDALALGETVSNFTGKPLVKYAPKRLTNSPRR